MKTSIPKVILPPTDKMTIRQIAAWQRLAINHNKPLALINGLKIDATGALTVDEDMARSYDEKLQQSPAVEKVSFT